MGDFENSVLLNGEDAYKEIMLQLEKKEDEEDEEFVRDEKEANLTPDSPKLAWTKIPKRSDSKSSVSKSQSFTIRKSKSVSQSSLSSSVDNRPWRQKSEGAVNNAPTTPVRQSKSLDESAKRKVKRSNSGSSNLSKTLNDSFKNAYSSPRQISTATMSMYSFDIQECIEKVKSIPKYASNGFRVLNTVKLAGELPKFDEEKTATYEKAFRSHLFLQILMNFDRQVKYDNNSGKDSCMKALFNDIIDSEITLKDSLLNTIISAAKHGESLLKCFYGDRIMLGKVLPKNRFSLQGTTDVLSFGEDRLGNKFKSLIMCKASGEKFVLSKSILEMFLHGLILDIARLHLLYYHLKDGSIALYEFKFKYDKLREFNKTLKVSQICENLFKGNYGHYEYKIVYKDTKDIELSKKRK